MSQIVSIVYRPGHLPAEPHDHYTRVPLETANLIVEHGIEGDAKGSNPKRQLNVMCAETLAELRAEGFMTDPGQMGEQIVVSGLDVNKLAPGDQVQLGEATIEVINHRTGCDRFEAIQGLKRTDCAGRMGIIAKVVTGGAIHVGDAVKALERTPDHV
jgi:MOSC domain-containing protein YiiM